MNELSCPKCKVGTVQRSTIYIEGERYNAFGCNKCDYGYWELFVDAKTYTVSTEGTADQFAKDISEMSDEKGIKTNEVDKMIQQEWFDKEGLKIIVEIPVLWQGWECDSKWYLCETENGKKVLVETNHNSPFISTAESLEEKIEEYKEVLAETEEALRILKGELTD